MSQEYRLQQHRATQEPMKGAPEGVCLPPTEKPPKSPERRFVARAILRVRHCPGYVVRTYGATPEQASNALDARIRQITEDDPRIQGELLPMMDRQHEWGAR